MRFIVTGGSGFIGNHLITALLYNNHQVINIDKLSRVSNREFRPPSRDYKLFKLDINDDINIPKIFEDFMPHGVFNLAALSHVESSIENPNECFDCNIDGLYNLLKISRTYFDTICTDQDMFRFIQVSTDEVYGSLNTNDPPFTEDSNYKPNTPYSATKAAGDMTARCYHKTYGLPVITTHCTNNFGTHQHPEKFIPKCIYRFLCKKPISIFGSGEQIRDWIHVKDHVEGLLAAYERGTVGESYLFGSEIGRTNNSVAETILASVARLIDINVDDDYILHTEDKNHDFRYAVDCTKTKEKLNWQPRLGFTTTIDPIVQWYFRNERWLKTMNSQQ
jgi:dTDP-glucose 4,6-dehydratase